MFFLLLFLLYLNYYYLQLDYTGTTMTTNDHHTPAPPTNRTGEVSASSPSLRYLFLLFYFILLMFFLVYE
jgi:hypothetical protein